MILNYKKYTPYLLAIFFVLIGMTLRYYSLYFISYDMKIFLVDWYDTMTRDGFTSLRDPFSNYTPPYLYLIWLATLTKSFLPKIVVIKLISIFFDLCNSFIVYQILRVKYPAGKLAILGAGTFLLLPTIFINSSFWGQADSIYTCFLLACLYFLIKDKPLTAIIFLGISFSFKAQAIFLAPLLLLLVVRKRIPWFYIGIIPLIYTLMMLPAILAGRPFLDVMTIYIDQVNTYRSLTLNAPNLYDFISNDLYTLTVKIGIAVTLVIIIIWVATYAHKIRIFSAEVIMICAYVSVTIVPFFLPKMHDRYFYSSDVLALLNAFYFPQLWFFVLGNQIISGMTYYIFLFLPIKDPARDIILSTAAFANTIIICLVLIAQWFIINKVNLSSEQTESLLPVKANDKREKYIISFLKKTANHIASFAVKWKHQLLFIAILAVGIFVRGWEFGNLPSGLNPDEASIGTEAYYIYKFGMDRNGISFPVHLISWGSGQNALYAYMLIPLVALHGINAMSVRLPMMISGILSLPLIYIAGKRLLGEKFALTAMFFLAISPWHIINTRWAVESNIMPFFFLAGFTTLLLSSIKNKWFIVSTICFALCLYAYGTAYVGVPIFFALTIPVLLYSKRISSTQAITGLAIFALITLPIALFIAENIFKWDAIHLGLITIPRLPVQARYQDMAAIFSKTPLQALSENIMTMLKLLWTQADAFPWNHVEPFGYFYKFTFPLVVGGIFLIMPFNYNKEKRTEKWLLLSWMIASICVGILHPVNLTRLNIIFTPILLCIAILVMELDKVIPRALSVMIFVFSIGFVLFTQTYHGEEYRRRASGAFNSGIIPAIEYATENGKSSICFTESTYSLYIYVLLTQKIHPSEYINNTEWLYPTDPIDPARSPREIGRYHFRISDCGEDPQAAYILLLKESPPNENINYKFKRFEKFKVYLPKN
jgi:Gpi18-like mannosyltransferase/4-amino-4-deoxy-L-arabinose transferase-like glycosyltransferase